MPSGLRSKPGTLDPEFCRYRLPEDHGVCPRMNAKTLIKLGRDVAPKYGRMTAAQSGTTRGPRFTHGAPLRRKVHIFTQIPVIFGNFGCSPPRADPAISVTPPIFAPFWGMSILYIEGIFVLLRSGAFSEEYPGSSVGYSGRWCGRGRYWWWTRYSGKLRAELFEKKGGHSHSPD